MRNTHLGFHVTEKDTSIAFEQSYPCRISSNAAFSNTTAEAAANDEQSLDYTGGGMVE